MGDAASTNTKGAPAPVETPAPAPDGFTILTAAAGERLGKRFKSVGGGRWAAAGGAGYPAEFTVREARFATLAEMFAVLREVAHDPRRCVIRAAPLVERYPTPVRKRLREGPVSAGRDAGGRPVYETDDAGKLRLYPPTFRDEPRRWLMLDADHIAPEAWQGLHPIREAAKIARRWRATLPEWLRGVAMIVQFSSSHGLPIDGAPVAKLHAWVLIDRALARDEAESLILGLGFDQALGRAVQNHYTADPVFRDAQGRSLPDPMGERWLLLDGAERAKLPPAGDPVWRPIRGASSASGRTTAPGEDVPSGYVASDDVRKGWRGSLDLAGCEVESGGHFRHRVMSALGSWLHREGPHADPAPLWSEVEPVLTRAAEARGEGYATAAREDYRRIFDDLRARDLAAEVGRVGERVPTTTEATPGDVLRRWPLKQRRAAREGRAGGMAWRGLDLRGVGAGKTERALREARAILLGIDRKPAETGADLLADPDAPVADRVYLVVQSHALAQEVEARARAIVTPEDDIAVLVWRGLDQPDPDGGRMCPRIGDMKAALETGGRAEDVCGVRGSGLCPHHRHAGGSPCGMMRQEDAAAELRDRRALVILAGSYFAANLPPARVRPDVSREGVDLAMADGTVRTVKLPEALAVVLDEWRPLDAHIVGGDRSERHMVALDDLGIVGGDGSPEADDWQAAVDLSAVETVRRFRADVDRPSPAEATALRRICGALQDAREGLEDRKPARVEALAEALRRRPYGVALAGVDVAALEPLRAVLRLALRAARKLVLEPRHLSRQHGAQEHAGMWETSRRAANSRRGRARFSADLAPPDLVDLLKHNARVLRVRKLLEALRQSLDDADRDGRGLLVGVRAASIEIGKDRTVRGWLAAMREDVAPAGSAPVVILDATAEERIVRRWFPSVSWADVTRDHALPRMPDSVLVRQVGDAQLGYSSVTGKRSGPWIARLRAFIEAAAAQHFEQGPGAFDVGVVMPKDTADRIGRLPPRVRVVTWGSEAGLDVLGDVPRGIVISRKLPPSGEVAFRAEVAFGKIIADADYVPVRADRLVRTPDGGLARYEGGKGRRMQMLRHADPDAETARRAIADASFDQGIGRFRLHRRTARTPLVLDLLTSHPARTVGVDVLAPLEGLRREVDDPGLHLAAAGIEPASRYGATLLAALASGRVADAYDRAGGGRVRKGAAQEDAEREDAAKRDRAVEAGCVSVRSARKVRAESETEGFPILYRNYINRESFGFSAGGWLPPPADIRAALASRPPARGVLKVRANSRPIRFTLRRLDPCETDADAAARLRARFGVPLHDFTIRTEPLDVLAWIEAQPGGTDPRHAEAREVLRTLARCEPPPPPEPRTPEPEPDG